MARLFAIGDIHGCRDELDVLLDAIDPGAGDKLVFVGDYVDRGPDSRGVVARLLTLAEEPGVECVFLKGNHEDMFLSYLGEEGSHGSVFLRNGGRATLASYGLDVGKPGEELVGSIPEEHMAFLRALRMHEVDAGFLFVHAGVNPLRQLDAQVPDDILWIREEFIRNRHLLPYTVIFGHTPNREVLWHLPFKIGLDTGCVYGNKLSGLDLRSGTLLQVRKGSRRADVFTEGPELDRLRSLIDAGARAHPA
jgi:serine/threonine protein phosphatase 1